MITGMIIKFHCSDVSDPELLLFVMVLSRESTSWDEIGMRCDNGASNLELKHHTCTEILSLY